MPIKVLLVEDQVSMRAALTAFLGCQPDFEVVGQAEDAAAAERLAAELKPQVVLMDLCLPDSDGIETIRRLKGAEWSGDDMGFVLISARLDESTRLKARAAGASVCVPKWRAFDQLEPAIRAAVTRA